MNTGTKVDGAVVIPEKLSLLFKDRDRESSTVQFFY
jgi:hypothetical protein